MNFKALLSTLSFLPFLLLLWNCSPASSTQQHYLWQLNSPESPSVYILGTLEKDTAIPVIDSLTLQVYSETGPIVLEMNPDSLLFQKQLLFTSVGYYDDDLTLNEKISPTSYTLIEQQLADYNWSLGHMPRMKPWLLLESLNNLADKQFGIHKNTLTTSLYQKAKADHKNIKHLLAKESQAYLLSKLSEEEQIELLELYLLHHQEIHGWKKEFINAYHQKKLGRLKNLIEKEQEIYAKSSYPQLIKNRNVSLSDAIIKEINKEQSILLLIDLKHLLGSEGVLKQLSEKNYIFTEY